MTRTNIYLDDDQVRALKHLAAEDRVTVSELVRRAIDAYVAARAEETRDWAARFGALVRRIQDRLPPDVSPETVEADVARAVAEVRAARRREGRPAVRRGRARA